MDFRKFNTEKCRKDFQRDVEQMKYEQLWQMNQGIALYFQWLLKYTANMYGASKRINDILEVHKIITEELLKRINKEE